MLKYFAVFVSMFFLFSVTFSQNGFDDQGNVNDPHLNERANACYEGGSMQDRCRVNFDWELGWYLIRVEFGIFTHGDIPSQFRPDSPIPATPVPVSTATPVPTSAPTQVPTPTPPSICVFVWSPSYYVDFSNSNIVSTGNYWADSSCTVYNGNLGRHWVYAPTGIAEANAICVANFGTNYSAIGSHGPLVFECV